MYTMQEKLKFKEDVMKCIHVCGGITGKYMKKICPDDELVFELMKAEKIRRIPVEVVKPDKSKYKMYLFEGVSKLKPVKFPNISEDDARKIALLNHCYINNKDVTWMGQEDVSTFIKGSGLKEKLVPVLMYYKDVELYSVHIFKRTVELTDHEKDDIVNKLNVDRVIEYKY
jgi:hypothetical protein